MKMLSYAFRERLLTWNYKQTLLFICIDNVLHKSIEVLTNIILAKQHMNEPINRMTWQQYASRGS